MTIPLRPRGVLVAIEGIDGAGKTTQVELVAAQLHVPDPYLGELKCFAAEKGFAEHLRLVLAAG